MREQTLTQLKPNDVIEWRDGKFGVNRRWRVHSIHIGANEQESVICIEALDRTPAWDEIHLPLMWVPEVLTRQCRIAGVGEVRK